MSALDAGRELDARIRDTFFPWDATRCGRCGWTFAPGGCQPDDCCMRPGPPRRADQPARYSKEIAAAWTVVEEMVRRGWIIDVQNRQVGRWACHVGFPAPNYAHVFECEDTAPHAICIAALKALADASPSPLAQTSRGDNA